MRERATDIHLDSNSEGILARLRVDGRILDATLLSENMGQRIINQFKAMARLNIERRFTPEESRIRYALPEQMADLRLTYTPTLHGHKLSIRVSNPWRRCCTCSSSG